MTIVCRGAIEIKSRQDACTTLLNFHSLQKNISDSSRQRAECKDQILGFYQLPCYIGILIRNCVPAPISDRQSRVPLCLSTIIW
jgi:hypothetical protein